MKIKKAIKKICTQNKMLKKAILVPYAMHCERRRVRSENIKNYCLGDLEVCLKDAKHLPGINFWFLLEQGHNNIGDIGIGIAERRFFKQHFPQVPMHFIYEVVYEKYYKEIKKEIQPRDVIVLRGGGSIGNTVMHEKHREDIIKQFGENFIISMPQTMCFPNCKNGERKKNRAKRIYTSNPNLILIAREEQSYIDMCNTFPNTQVLLTPDIVMALNYSLPVLERKGILLCFRSDWEKSLSPDDIKMIENECRTVSNDISYTDMYADEEFVPFEKREEVFNAKIAQFKTASLVITDRLHGMVFSAITSTPCIALSNYNHKVEQTYKWLQDLPFIRYCHTVEEALSSIQEMYYVNPCIYSEDFALPYFENLAEIIKLQIEE